MFWVPPPPLFIARTGAGPRPSPALLQRSIGFLIHHGQMVGYKGQTLNQKKSWSNIETSSKFVNVQQRQTLVFNHHRYINIQVYIGQNEHALHKTFSKHGTDVPTHMQNFPRNEGLLWLPGAHSCPTHAVLSHFGSNEQRYKTT